MATRSFSGYYIVGTEVKGKLDISNTVFPRLECARSINFILALTGGLFEGTLRLRAHSIELKHTASSQFI